MSQKWQKIAKTCESKINSSKSSVLFKVWMKSIAETMWKQYSFKEGWVWSFFCKVFLRFPNILMGIYFLFFAIFVKTVLRIVTKVSTPFPIILHVLIHVLCMGTQSCSTSYMPKFGGRRITNFSMRNNVFLYVLCTSGTQKRQKRLSTALLNFWNCAPYLECHVALVLSQWLHIQACCHCCCCKKVNCLTNQAVKAAQHE